jgi:hypothetical protein
MIDTVILILPFDQFKVIEPDKFNINFNEFLRLSGHRTVWNNGSSKFDYYPRITAYKRPKGKGCGISVELKIEFSCPKIIFGNNIEELSEEHFENLIMELQKKLKERGVLVLDNDYLRKARVSAVHYSKNILLIDRTTPTMILSELYKVDITGRLDLSKVKYRNGGHTLSFYAGSNSLVFYDKLLDEERPKNRSEDKDGLLSQAELAEEIREFSLRHYSLEILRMEVRLCQKPKIKSVLDKQGFTGELIFENLFSKDLSRAVLLDYWKTLIEEKNKSLFSQTTKDQAQLLDALLETNVKSANKLLQAFGFYLYAQIRSYTELKSRLREKRPSYNWNREKGKHKKLIDEAFDFMEQGSSRGWEFVDTIKKELEDFRPFDRDQVLDGAKLAELVRGDSLF